MISVCHKSSKFGTNACFYFALLRIYIAKTGFRDHLHRRKEQGAAHGKMSSPLLFNSYAVMTLYKFMV
ncbi:hypothetical protein Cpin_5134 [Chitinophaga pinensis DSM 2588]|uniref:Uncharacterized protein n=1 Tax=Chitinophaga pinensis (strain ATCC 43595 / DSM 2588 / LMG 13176 / NBRC 15968 / NCIMB 11800 / UQM 2034) TaxID=485918 RepID=A0A979G8A0_CHIPD|nr:hypothetical protein Cpin_5134 [Chitinophaga pinensis DSM 2588]